MEKFHVACNQSKRLSGIEIFYSAAVMQIDIMP